MEQVGCHPLGTRVAFRIGMAVRNLLALVDFSEGSLACLARAIEIARARDAGLVVLHATGGTSPLPEGLRDRIARVAQAELTRCTELAERHGARAEGWLHPGSPSDAFAEVARAVAPDLVVVGARGQTNLRRLWLGSTAERIVQDAACAVLVVREPKATGLGMEPVHRVLWATDGSPDAEAAIARAIEIAPAAEMHVVHVASGVPGTDGAPGAGEAARGERSGALDRWAAAHGAIAHPRRGRVVREVLGAARSLDADLLVVGAIGARGELWTRIGGVATRIAREAPCSVLVGREPGSVERVRDHLSDAAEALDLARELASDQRQAIVAIVDDLRVLTTDARAAEDEWLRAIALELEGELARIELAHPRLADALGRAVQLLARMGI